jgi:hypothetical protein
MAKSSAFLRMLRQYNFILSPSPFPANPIRSKLNSATATLQNLFESCQPFISEWQRAIPIYYPQTVASEKRLIL